mmetsp:Transcript_22852/g.74423  ORF Transcript_22852/g.74423 Transcript_22852/m.74423 type:complete len:219 (+) Transcript_22852:3915-4571(+)
MMSSKGLTRTKRMGTTPKRSKATTRLRRSVAPRSSRSPRLYSSASALLCGATSSAVSTCDRWTATTRRTLTCSAQSDHAGSAREMPTWKPRSTRPSTRCSSSPSPCPDHRNSSSPCTTGTKMRSEASPTTSSERPPSISRIVGTHASGVSSRSSPSRFGRCTIKCHQTLREPSSSFWKSGPRRRFQTIHRTHPSSVRSRWISRCASSSGRLATWRRRM